MHGPNCKLGSFCTTGRRLQEVNVLGGLILPVLGHCQYCNPAYEMIEIIIWLGFMTLTTTTRSEDWEGSDLLCHFFGGAFAAKIKDYDF
ncbi:hypothetical protein SASPL_155978 [Salvia splendens]|uniref:Uncharacterized protein n=1 Tax=Salvia splendens TaxID=180675 RepID=A0A8X8VXN5_SALSN|nr:hypothetical protein SASPL_155978 [Salvia splendens]